MSVDMPYLRVTTALKGACIMQYLDEFTKHSMNDDMVTQVLKDPQLTSSLQRIFPILSHEIKFRIEFKKSDPGLSPDEERWQLEISRLNDLLTTQLDRVEELEKKLEDKERDLATFGGLVESLRIEKTKLELELFRKDEEFRINVEGALQFLDNNNQANHHNDNDNNEVIINPPRIIPHVFQPPQNLNQFPNNQPNFGQNQSRLARKSSAPLHHRRL